MLLTHTKMSTENGFPKMKVVFSHKYIKMIVTH